MTRQAALNVWTESEPVCVHFSKVNKLPYNTVYVLRFYVEQSIDRSRKKDRIPIPILKNDPIPIPIVDNDNF